MTGRIEVDRDSVEKGLASLVLTIVELLRQLMERQALRRVDLVYVSLRALLSSVSSVRAVAPPSFDPLPIDPVGPA